MWVKAYVVAIASMLSGAAVVHNIWKPDLVGASCNRLLSPSPMYERLMTRCFCTADDPHLV